MASPEHAENRTPQFDPAAALAAIERQLEKADEIENPIERFFKREYLLEKHDELQAEMDETTPPTSE